MVFIVLFLQLFSLIVLSPSYAATNLCVRYPSGGPVNCVDSTGGSGNVGIGTVNYVPEYIGVSTLGPSNMVIVAGNIGIDTVNPISKIQVNSTTSSFSVDNNGNVGIGTINTQAGLFVYSPSVNLPQIREKGGDSTTSPRLTLTNNSADIMIVQQAASGAGNSLGSGLTASPEIVTFSSTKPFLLGNNGDVALQFYENNLEKMRIAVGGNVGIASTAPGQTLDVFGGARILNSGNLGIGTSYANQKLTVAGTIYSTSGGFQFPNNTIQTTAATATTPAGSNNDIQYNSSNAFGASDLFVLQNGNLGIGTSAPTSVIGANRVLNIGGDTNTPGIEFKDNGGTQNTLFMQNSSTGYWFRVSGAATASNNQFFFATSNANSSSSDTRRIWMPSQGGMTIGSTYVTNGNLPNNQGLLLQGNLTIGETTVLNGVDIGNSYAIAMGNYAGVNGVQGGGFATSENVGIGTWDVTKQKLTVSGNVGIGTYIAGQALTVAGTVYSTSGGFKFPDNTTQTTAATGGGTPGGSSPQLQYNNASAFGGITSGGSDGTNIGIGTVSFKNTLNVVGTVGIGTTAVDGYVSNTLVSPMAMTVGGNVGIGTWKASNIFAVVGSASIGTATYANTTTQPNSLNVSGNVGIGSINPTTPLSIVADGSGNAFFIVGSSGQFKFQSGGVNGAGLLSQNNTSTNGFVIGTVAGGSATNAGNYIRIQPAGQNAITADNNGNVGIGSTAPQAMFVVGSAGHFRSTGTAPTVANNDCGTTAQGTVAAGSTDIKGKITAGTLNVTSCAMTFNTTASSVDVCICQDDTTTTLGTPCTASTTKLTITSATSMSGDVISYHCID